MLAELCDPETSASCRKDSSAKLNIASKRCKQRAWLTLGGDGGDPLACCVGVGPLLCHLYEAEEGLDVDSCHHSRALLGACGETGGQSEVASDQSHGPERETLPWAGVRVLHTSRCSHRSHKFHHKSLDRMAVPGL